MLLLFVVTLSAANAAGNDAKNQAIMKVSPEQCVGMQQGQACYVSVQLNWQVDVPGNYCLFKEGDSTALYCWLNVSNGEFTKAFNSRVNLSFSLKRQNESIMLATAVVKMAWVHKKKGQPRKSWRIF